MMAQTGEKGGHPCCRGSFLICPLCEIVPHGIFPRSAPWPSGALCPSGNFLPFWAMAFLVHRKHKSTNCPAPSHPPTPGDCSDFQGEEVMPSSALQARKSAPCCTQRPQAMLGTLESKDT